MEALTDQMPRKNTVVGAVRDRFATSMEMELPIRIGMKYRAVNMMTSSMQELLQSAGGDDGEEDGEEGGEEDGEMDEETAAKAAASAEAMAVAAEAQEEFLTTCELSGCPLIYDMPAEYCEYGRGGSMFEQCLPLLRAHFPDLALCKYDGMTVQAYCEAVDRGETPGGGGKKGKKRGGGIKRKGDKKDKNAGKEARVTIELAKRGKRKYVTTVVGLENFNELKLKGVKKDLSKKFAGGCSVGKRPDGGEEICIQGDYKQELPGLLRQLYKIPANQVYFLEKGGKQVCCVKG